MGASPPAKVVCETWPHSLQVRYLEPSDVQLAGSVMTQSPKTCWQPSGSRVTPPTLVDALLLEAEDASDFFAAVEAAALGAVEVVVLGVVDASALGAVDAAALGVVDAAALLPDDADEDAACVFWLADAAGAGALSGLRRLAFGRINDALMLLREDAPGPEAKNLDLFSVAEIKRPKGGGIEIKFFDRLEALTRLAELEAGAGGESSADSFFAALRGSADRDVEV